MSSLVAIVACGLSIVALVRSFCCMGTDAACGSVSLAEARGASRCSPTLETSHDQRPDLQPSDRGDSVGSEKKSNSDAFLATAFQLESGQVLAARMTYLVMIELPADIPETVLERVTDATSENIQFTRYFLRIQVPSGMTVLAVESAERGAVWKPVNDWEESKGTLRLHYKTEGAVFGHDRTEHIASRLRISLASSS